ncbi:MAG TPA: DUF5000 domain-containing lipoprotein [Membranihabitans sp.]|nr:DUF5000 domain-containing lipoprotein [Membranihabitans sp.]
MKKLNLSGLLCWGFILFWISCGDELDREALYKDNTPPGPVAEPVVENIPGGALITYQIPPDEDVLSVEASFQRSGETITKSASIFTNKITIDGLKSGAEYVVALRTVDRSNNYSNPVNVTINPLEAPIDVIMQNLVLTQDFGGVRIEFDNQVPISIEFQLLKKDSLSNAYEYQFSAFNASKAIKSHTFRGFPPVPADFAVLAIDRWNNISDTIYRTITPLEEIEFDPSTFGAPTPRLPLDQGDAFGWVLPNMWDGTISDGNGFHTDQIFSGYDGIGDYTEKVQMFTIDLGIEVNISRIKFWHRQGTWIFSHGNPRFFEMWGIDKIPTGYDGTNFDGWSLLVDDGEVIKPSESPIGVNSAEDVAAAVEGHEFNCDNPNAKVRYIRFVNFKNWSGSTFIHISEMKFWGTKVE